VNAAVSIQVKTPAPVFELLTSGYLDGRLVKNGQQLKLEDPAQGEAGGDVC
jgi:hypothetical protein